MSAPFFSILTPAFNRAGLIATAIDSVQKQGVEGVEHWVIDGASTDGTLDVLTRYPRLRVISEPDRGIYDALNKGLERATGEIVGLLNTDDHYAPNIFARIRDAFRDPDVDAVYGGAEIYEEVAGKRRVIRRFTTAEQIDLSLENVTVGVGTINARFWRRSFLQRLGSFDLRYRIASDRDLLLRAALAKPRAVLLDEIVYYYRLHPESLTFHHGEPRYREEHFALCDDYLSRPDLALEARPWLRRLYTKETIQSAVSSAYRGDFRGTAAATWRGCVHDPLWPARFGKEAVIALKRRFGFTDSPAQ